jgi:hypothetical protein
MMDKDASSESGHHRYEIATQPCCDTEYSDELPKTRGIDLILQNWDHVIPAIQALLFSKTFPSISAMFT